MKIYILSAIALLSLAFGTNNVNLESSTAKNTNELILQFENMAGEKPVQLNAAKYKNSANEEFSISLSQYFISNISLKKKDGTIVTVPQDASYFLVRETEPESKKIRLQLPEGKYESVTFTLGIDSLRNTKPLTERTGILDPAGGAEGMYWGWNSGYIFFKMEGNAEAAPAGKNGDKKFRYHIGLFGGMNSPTVNNIKVITLNLRSLKAVKLTAKNNPVIHIKTDILKMFTGINTISIAKNPVVMVSPFSANIANNYADMFSLTGIDN